MEKIKSLLPDFIDLILDAVCVVDADGHYVFVSAAYERIFGYSREEVIGKQMADLIFPEDRERTRKAVSQIMSGHPIFNFENRYVRKDGHIINVRWSARWSEEHQLRIAVAHEVTDLKQAEALQAAIYAISEAAHATEDLDTLFEHIHGTLRQLLPANNLIVATRNDETGDLDYPYKVQQGTVVSPELDLATAAFCAEIISSNQALLLSPEEMASLREQAHPVADYSAVCWLGVPLNSSGRIIGALVLRSYCGDDLYTEKDKGLLQYVSTQIATAIERKQLHEQLEYMARYDPLTTLPNRVLLYDRLQQAIARSCRMKTIMGVLYLDVNNFKDVNDTFGHATGDLLLVEFANRVKQSIRESDTVGRMGGDEFVVILEDLKNASDIETVSAKICNSLTVPINIENQAISIQVSVGTAVYPQDGTELKQLLKIADDAMYAFKKKLDLA